MSELKWTCAIRDTTPTRTPEWGQSVSVLAQEGGPAERPLRRTEAQIGTDVRDSMVRTGPAATASVKGTKLSWNMKRGSQSDNTLDSGMGTLWSQGNGPRLEYLLPDTIMGRGFTPLIRPNYRARPRHLGHYWTPILDVPPPLSPTPGTQPEPGLGGPQQVIPAIIAQLQSDVHTLKMASPIQLNLVTGTQPVRACQLDLWRYRSFVETLVGTSIDRCLMQL